MSFQAIRTGPRIMSFRLFWCPYIAFPFAFHISVFSVHSVSPAIGFHSYIFHGGGICTPPPTLLLYLGLGPAQGHSLWTLRPSCYSNEYCLYSVTLNYPHSRNNRDRPISCWPRLQQRIKARPLVLACLFSGIHRNQIISLIGYSISNLFLYLDPLSVNPPRLQSGFAISCLGLGCKF